MPIQYLRGENGEVDDVSRNEALAWFRMELEQLKTANSPGYIFVDGDAREIPQEWIAKMGKSHVLGLLGLCNDLDDTEEQVNEQVNGEDENAKFETQYAVADNGGSEEKKGQVVDDDMSTSSSESDNSDAPVDDHVMHIVGRIENGVRSIAVQEDVAWDAEILLYL